MLKAIALGPIHGIRIGHAEHPEAGTGCTVVFRREGAAAGVDALGLLAARSAPRAVVVAVKSARPLFGLKAHSDLRVRDTTRPPV